MAKKGTIIYVGDPMCSWCWGISNELSQIIDDYQEILNFQLILGGLRPGGGDPWTDNFKDFLREHWKKVNLRSGQDFNYDLLKLPEFNYDTEPSCRAVRIVRDLSPDKEFAFFTRVQHQFYVGNQDPNLTSFYKNICENMGIDFVSFQQKFESQEYKDKTYQDFQEARNLGINGFPSIVLKTQSRVFPVALGFSDYFAMSSRIDQSLQQLPSLN